MVRTKSDQITPTKQKNANQTTRKRNSQTDLYAALGIEKSSNYKPKAYEWN